MRKRRPRREIQKENYKVVNVNPANSENSELGEWSKHHQQKSEIVRLTTKARASYMWLIRDTT